MIITLMQKKLDNEKIICHLLYNNGEITSDLNIGRLKIEDKHNYKFGSSLIRCILKQEKHNIRLPIAVALTYNNEIISKGMTNFTAIKYSQYPSKTFQHQLVICGPILKRKFNNSLRLVEFIEFNKILGATKFYFYNYSIAKEVSKILKFYEENGTVEILQWNTRLISEKDVTNYGFTAAFNDCYYRASFYENVKYIGNIDVDEILMPLSNDTYTLLELLSKIDNETINAFIFENIYLKPGRKLLDSIKTKNNNNFLYANVLTLRSLPFRHPFRSKYIAKGRYHFSLRCHTISRAIRNTSLRKLLHDEAYLFHYRDKIPVNATIVDRSALRFVKTLSSSVDKVCINIFNKLCRVVIHKDYHNTNTRWDKFKSINITELGVRK